MPEYYPFNPDPRAPVEAPPARTCDAQFHVFGDPAVYPPRPEAPFKMPSATIDAALKMHRALGIERGVIVQATTYGADHSVVVDALKKAGPDYRGCANAIALKERDDGYIEELHDAGVRGARFTFRKELGVGLSPREFQRAADRLKELGWYVKIQPEKDGIMGSVELYENLDIPVLIDHLGRADANLGVDDPNVRKTIELLKKGNFWVMLSLGEKISTQGHPWNDVLPIARAYIDAAPDRVVWASDWPHPLSKSPPPNDAELLELLYRYAPDAGERQKILVDNPAKLFGYDD
ncbi:MAG: amidohydrolase family protein [Alcanivorax sp.]|uniref:Amidohydrolase family protein n=1 Tax=Alloalcanivorax marinus TaxID=1177169 RepID=A0A9Q3UNC8_9GAMM|nr:amidohydrolase family protein [Alloalcanivorax marinus]MBM7332764.1 amidohydrolase family protein [Alloalcanivorax marinus]MCC4309146.1 amidohydrolase family protein [Alloalcanivorax marinus]